MLLSAADPVSSGRQGDNSKAKEVLDVGGASNRDSLMQTLEPVVLARGFDLEEVVVTPAGKRRVLRVVVDKDGGVDLDDIAGVSTAVAATLDESDAMGPVPYVLEVTSPGVDRPLTLPRHWRRAAERLVRVGIAGVGDRTGRVVSVDDAAVLLDIEGTEQRVVWADLGSGHVQIEFNRKATSGQETHGTPENDE
jgi:ribosome maturation factor RimP